jgi:hypothetical protein
MKHTDTGHTCALAVGHGMRAENESCDASSMGPVSRDPADSPLEPRRSIRHHGRGFTADSSDPHPGVRRIQFLQVEWSESSLALTGQDWVATARLLESFGYGLFRPDDDGKLSPIENYDFGPDVFALHEISGIGASAD